MWWACFCATGFLLQFTAHNTAARSYRSADSQGTIVYALISSMSLKLPDIHACEKALSSAPSWSEGENGILSLMVPLEIKGMTVEGLRIRLKAIKDMPDEAVVVQLEMKQLARSDFAIERIDWRASHAHTNPNKGPANLQLKQFKLRDSHHHRFVDNWHGGNEQLLKSNLPIACAPETEIPSYEKLLENAREWLRIVNLHMIPVPPWERKLL